MRGARVVVVAGIVAGTVHDARAESEARRWQGGLDVGVAVPRVDPGVGTLVRGRVGFVVTPRRPIIAHVAVDWTRFVDSSTSLVSPPDFPRSRAQVASDRSVATLAVGASIRFAAFDRIVLAVAASLGPQWSHDRFEAYGASAVETTLGMAGTIEVSAEGPAGPVRWRGSLAWREASRPRDGTSTDGERVTSGALAALGVSW